MDCSQDCASCPLVDEETTEISQNEPIDEPADFVAQIACRVKAALALLVESHGYALRFDRSPADFPVEVAELKKAGLTNNDLRGLVYVGVVEQVPCPTARPAAGGAVARAQAVAIPETACYILTPKGLVVAWQALSKTAACVVGQKVPNASTNGHGKASSVKPKWDVEKQELLLGSVLVKQFKVPASNQVRILSAFEEDGWPPRIDDPLSVTTGVDPKRRLHHTINSLNGNQTHPLIRFMGDGTGTGVRWELREATHHAPGQNGHAPNGHVQNGHAPNGHARNGHTHNGHVQNGHVQNGHAENGHADPIRLARMVNKP